MKKIIWIIICNIFIHTLFGSNVDSIFAKSVAKNFYLSRITSDNKAQHKSLSTREINLQLVYQECSASEDSFCIKTPLTNALYYIFNINNNGFIIVSADDNVKPILGYSLTSKFSLTDQPPAYIAWMNRYKDQIKYLKESNLKYTRGKHDDWTKYSGLIITESDAILSESGPLLSTNWGQGCYYNECCPVDYRGPCYKAWAGCMATAMGQIMKFWEHPSACNNIPGYTNMMNYDNDGNPISNTNYLIPSITSDSYIWSNMPDNLSFDGSRSQKSAISKLLYHCGVAVKMNYGPNNSGSAISEDIVFALTYYFNYSSSARLIYKVDYSDLDWKNQLKNELDNNRPIIYMGYGTGNHAFVCDGYQDSDYFHFNWGWEGLNNGYFYLDDLTPGSHDYTDQIAIIGIYPDLLGFNSALFDASKISVYPKPSSNKIYLKSGSDINTEISILLFDYSGQLVYSNSIDKMLSDESFEIDISLLKHGVYVLQLNNSKWTSIEKVIKQ